MDLREKKLRACSVSAMMDDPVRILRGIRLAAAFRIPPPAGYQGKDEGSCSFSGKDLPGEAAG